MRVYNMPSKVLSIVAEDDISFGVSRTLTPLSNCSKCFSSDGTESIFVNDKSQPCIFFETHKLSTDTPARYFVYVVDYSANSQIYRLCRLKQRPTTYEIYNDFWQVWEPIEFFSIPDKARQLLVNAYDALECKMTNNVYGDAQ